eukprot:m.82420 g.82420  ORF g.82420 m.82420 type:complete len:933 (+) comp12870_c0_seq3:75-2873(+)
MAVTRCYVLALATICLIHAVDAKIWQNKLFSDNMILESREAYDIRPFVAGFGDTPGEQVTVYFDRGEYPTEVGADGKWEVQMNSCNKGIDKVLSVVSSTTNLTYVNVACGQVYVCSGQSNMGLPLSYVMNATAEIAASNRPNWRLFVVQRTFADTPQDDFNQTNQWVVSSNETTPRFSATCYLTARHIAEMYWGDGPIGLIQSDWGGTRVEAWCPDSVKQTCAHITPGPPEIPEQQAYSALYNAMINPLVHYSIRGVIWFQGEHNVVTHSSEELYACEFQGMINAWRDAWKGIGDFPFLYVQLAPYTGYAPFAGHGDISTIRLAQADTLPHIGLDTSGMAVAIDLGDPEAPAGDVHSRLKEQVAYRLALQALHVMYAFQEGENVTNSDYPNETPNPQPLHFSGPMPNDISSDGSSVTISFDYGYAMYLNDTQGCKIHRGINFDGKMIGGECCKAKDTFQLCTGSRTNTTTLSCTNVTSIDILPNSNKIMLKVDGEDDLSAYTVVRYAYANYPQCALYNKYELPSGPFVMALPGATVKNEVSGKDEVAGKERVLDPPAQTPPMGLNSWNAFHCNVDERKMRAMADAFVSTGLAKVGYEYVNIDDCWQVQRSPNGSINYDPARFPGGMKALADYVHKLGLKFGVYTAQRELTCQRRPGSWEHEEIDVQSYCDWGVDYVKLDACAGRGYTQQNESWIKFRAAIDKCSKSRGFPMVLSVESCDDPTGCGLWIGELANLWRTGGDIQATFASVMNNVRENTKMAAKAGPTGGPLGGGHWNDADMLQVGNIGLSLIEQRTHFSLWAMMASPLLIGTDVSLLTNESLMILGNAEVTAVNQDPLGHQAVPVGPNAADPGTASCWAKQLKGGNIAAMLINTGDNKTTVTCALSDLGISNSGASVRDLLNHKSLPSVTKGGSIKAMLESHDHQLLKLTPTQN